MRHRLNITILSNITILAFFLLPDALGWSQMYHLTDLGTLEGGNSFPTALNNLGQVTGYSDTESSPRAFLYSNGGMTNLASPNDSPTYAYGINDSGSVVGKFLTPGGGSHPFVYSAGTYTDLYAPDAFGQGVANGINNVGQIVGNDFFQFPQITPKTDFAALQFPTATAINDAGQVAGYINPSFGPKRAFIYSGGTMTDLGLIRTGSSIAYGINAAGDVVGSSEIDVQGHTHAFLYSKGIMTDLSLLGFGDVVNTAAVGINSKGQIVGGHFLYENGATIDLESVIDNLQTNPGGDGWSSIGAMGINDSGWIIASAHVPQDRFEGNYTHAVLLTPVPEPSSLIFATAGCGVVFVQRRKRGRCSSGSSNPGA